MLKDLNQADERALMDRIDALEHLSEIALVAAASLAGYSLDAFRIAREYADEALCCRADKLGACLLNQAEILTANGRAMRLEAEAQSSLPPASAADEAAVF